MDATLDPDLDTAEMSDASESLDGHQGAAGVRRPSRREAEEAVRTLIRWAGDDVDREGLLDTPRRMATAWRAMFGGYGADPAEPLARTFEEVGGYRDMVLLRDIEFHSHCEHHILPIIGRAHVAYYPDRRVVGLSKIARVVDLVARRLQTQERLTAEIVEAIETHLKPAGIAVLVEAEHLCMAMRGVQKAGVSTMTTGFTGRFADAAEQMRFLTLLQRPHAR